MGRLVCALALVLGGTACASGGDTAIPSRVSIVAGEPEPHMHAVVALVRDDGSLRCSATLVAERVVLTAAHCGVVEAASRWQVAAGPSLADAERFEVTHAVGHPLHRSGSATHDLALMLLGESPGITPVALAAMPPPVGATVRIVGWGQSGPEASDGGLRRSGVSMVERIDSTHMRLRAAPASPCLGDSGGAVLWDPGSGEVLVGVISRGPADCADGAEATRVDAERDDFVRPTLASWAPASVPVGGRCWYDAQCAQGSCTPAIDVPALRFCATACASGRRCPPRAQCHDGYCKPAPPSPGAPDAPCATDEDCAVGHCETDLGVCVLPCVPGHPDACPAPRVCRRVERTEFHCVVIEGDAASAGCGCGPVPSAPMSAATWAAALVGAFALRGPRRARRGHRRRSFQAQSGSAAVPSEKVQPQSHSRSLRHESGHERL
ncbi:MAG: trypsin-like serine protease [Myxococcota bacterium]|nr:trypsin-like serine protease [Myxococcota bacterium]MDW8362022.1 trypsin-like serine protease [Myxococcales bacterium]